ncbi:GntR family transcriptional regulator [Vibrio coralliilyticus]|uniref:GntR family transcriptional regulator n=2 Tax=Vibrio coralliilyticus TaxID=190893 RepID=A0A837G6B8_9VIBR|nr:FCD domain-containing protein [Vibrio coralliilyticus]KJY69493.1 GntR family transcriptional regulator [Vibrio coralliilyticus]MCC2520973.1 FCD domain-containing protein [Vibrio coralliilyticus]PAU39770.1 GntR family transcriptional regulator [Vibrio coralliilyticus]QOU32809.1 FCD domain-containing protein [Vibrio coralliilyticus]
MELASFPLKPMKKTKLSDSVADEIEKLIINKTLKEGDTLPSERELMAAFDVGRPSVREALLKLSQKGLVEIKSGEKTRVTKPCTDTLLSNISGLAIALLSQQDEKRQFEQLRQLFEIAMVREAARVRTEDDLARLKMILEQNKLHCSNYDEFVETDIAFHRCIINMIDNPMISSLYESLISWLIKTRNPEDYTPYHEQNYQEHVKIYQAIAQGDADLAETEMRAHLEAVMRIEK